MVAKDNAVTIGISVADRQDGVQEYAGPEHGNDPWAVGRTGVDSLRAVCGGPV